MRYAVLLTQWARETRKLVTAWDGADEEAVTREALALIAEARRRLDAAVPAPAPDPGSA